MQKFDLDTDATFDDLMDFLADLSKSNVDFKYAKEWFFAKSSLWNTDEYSELFKNYIISTQIDVKPEDDKARLKGKPFEDLARYFLKNGGIVKEVKDIKAGDRWQVDGQGILIKSSLEWLWGEELMKKIGFQLYLECKNKKDPATKEQFNDHCCRMEDNDCYLGIMASTSGFKISRGGGIAERVYNNRWKNKYHLLLTIRDFNLVIEKKMPPLAVLTEAIERTTNDEYRSCRETIKRYTPRYCTELALKCYETYCT